MMGGGGRWDRTAEDFSSDSRVKLEGKDCRWNSCRGSVDVFKGWAVTVFSQPGTIATLRQSQPIRIRFRRPVAATGPVHWAVPIK